MVMQKPIQYIRDRYNDTQITIDIQIYYLETKSVV